MSEKTSTTWLGGVFELYREVYNMDACVRSTQQCRDRKTYCYGEAAQSSNSACDIDEMRRMKELLFVDAHTATALTRILLQAPHAVHVPAKTWIKR